MDENLQIQNDENTQTNNNEDTCVMSPSAFLNVNEQTNDPILINTTNCQTSNYKRAFYTIFELTDDELFRLDDTLRDKIVNHAENFLQKHDTLQTSYEKFKIECEQRFVELETEYSECQNKLTFESKNAHLFQIKANENEDKLMTLTKQNRILDNEKETLISNQQRLNTINQNLEAEKRDLLNLLDKRIKENDRLNEEWKSMNTKLTETESKICEYTAQLEELRNKESSITLRERQFQSDKERLLNEIDWLNQQLKEKSMQLLESKGTLNQKIYDLESKIEEYTAETRQNKNLIENLQETNRTMESQIEELTSKLQDTREKEVKLRIEFSEESMQRDKLIEMYMEENSKCKLRLEEAAEAIRELNQMISEAKDEYSRLADEKALNETAFEVNLKEKDEINNKLEQELKNANELLMIAKRKGATVLSESDIEQLSPAAAVASKLLKSGMTLTQIYSEYVNLTETLQNEKKENERLKSYIAEVINEIEEKAPIMRRQKHEYEESIKTISNLTSQLENAYMDYEVLKSKSEDSIKKYNSLSSENVRLKQDIRDMSRQVTVLLNEVEQLRSKRGYKIEDNPDSTLANLFATNDSNDSYFEVTSSSESLNKSSFIFRNIEELQKQNQELKRLLNEITDKKQSEEKAELEIRTKEFNEKLNLAIRELEEFKTQREKQEQVLDEIRKQRDTYKHLLVQQQSQTQPRLSSVFCTSTPGGDRMRSNSPGNFDLLIDQEQLDFKKKYDQVCVELDKVKTKFEKYQEEMSKNNRSLNNDVDQLRSNNSDLSLKLALSESKLEGTLEKCKTLNTAAEKLRKELETYKERISKANEMVIKHEQSITLTTIELNRSKERISELETRLHSSSVERDMYKSNYDRLSKEHELLVKENNSRSSILSNLEMIRNSCERNERETKQILSQKIEQLERELVIQQKQAEQDKEQNSVLLKSWQSQYEQLNQQRQVEVSEYEKMKTEFNENKLKLEELQSKYNEVEAKLHSNEMIVQMSRNTKSSAAISRLTHLEEETKDLQMKLALGEKEIVSLKIQLEDSKAHAKQYKNISDTMEKTMKEESEAHAKSQEIYEQRTNDLNNELNALRVKYDEMVILKSQLEVQYNQDKDEFDSKVSVLEKEKKDLENEVKQLENRIENTELILDERTKARDDFAAKLTVSDEQVKDLTEKIGLFETKNSMLTTRVNELKSLLDAKTNELENEKKSRIDQVDGFNKTENVFNEEISKLKAEISDLIEQNSKLQTEFSKVGQDLVTLQKQELGSSLNIDEQSSSNLLEINRYLRTQKEQLEEKYESLKLTHEITRQRLVTLDNDLDFYKKKCDQLESGSKGDSVVESSQTSADNFNLLIDTNKRLKEELDLVNSENSRLNEEVNKIGDEVSNLRSNLNACELKNESSTIENTFLKTEVKKLKERIDSLYSQSDMAEEWSRVQAEIREAQDKNTTLTDMINELRGSLTDSNLRYENLLKEFESQRTQLTGEFGKEMEKVKQELEGQKSQLGLEKQKLQLEIDTAKTERKNREEMFKTLVNELKDVVSAVQKEFQLKDIDWAGPKGAMQDRIRLIKEEIGQIKKLLIEKIRADKEEIQKKSKQIEESQTELPKKLEECEQKVKERETKIGQLMNVLNTNRGKIQNYQKQVEDLTKELNECKSNPQHSEQSSRTIEFDQLRSKFLQSQIDNEKLKKDLAATNQALAEAKSNPCSTSSNLVTSPSSSQAPITIESIQQQQQQPPTAYIAPSRIATKVAPSQPQQQQAQVSQNLSSLRRTAAVQPTPHITQSNVENQQQMNQNQETFESEENRIQHQVEEPAPSTSREASLGNGSLMAKRTREEDHSEDSSSQASTNNKKQRSSQETAFINVQGEQQQQQQTDQRCSESNVVSAQQTDNNQYIVINDELQGNEAQEIEPQEIVLDDEASDGFEDVIITSSGNQGDDNQNSNESNFNQEEGSNEQIEEGQIDDDTMNPGSNEIEEIQENLVDTEENSGDIHLEIQPDETDENQDVIEDQERQKSESPEVEENVNKDQTVESSETEDKSAQQKSEQTLQAITSRQAVTSTNIQTTRSTSGVNPTTEKPQPIVWDGPPSSTVTTTRTSTLQPQQTLKLRRAPPVQQQQLQTDPAHRFNQYRLNNTQFQTQNVTSSGQTVMGQNEIPQTSTTPQTRILTQNRMQRTQAPGQTQTPGRVIPRPGLQPGPVVRGGLARGAGNANRGGRNF